VLRLLAVLMVLACGPAVAGSSASGHAKPAHEKGSGFAGPRVPTVAMPTLVAPVIVSGELDHYVFLSVTLELTEPAHKKLMLEKVPYLQDAFLREVHQVSIAKDNDPTVLDDAGLKERLLRVSATVVGERVVQAVELRHIVQAVH
jgi:hypothetical protein